MKTIKTIKVEGKSMRYEDTLDVLRRLCDFSLVFRIESIREKDSIFAFYIEYEFEFSDKDMDVVDKLLEKLEK